MKATTSWQHESPASALGSATSSRNPGSRSRSVEIRQDDLDELPNRWASGGRPVYEMPALGWRYG